jgi:peptidoglycan-associated lipoprotein
MKLLSQKLCLVVASSALVLAGCTKKPARPDPSLTAMGMQPSNTSTVNPDQVATMTPSPDLAGRDGGFDAGDLNRTALQAQTVYFDFDKSDVKSAERTKLQAAKDYLDKNPDQKLLLEGHCDWRGTAEYNLSLGDRRANAVKKYLLSLGVAADRLDTLSKGSLEASKNADDATRAKDRRVDLVATHGKGTGAMGAAPAGALPPATPAPAPAGSAL